MAITQASRIAAIATPLGEDVLCLKSFSASERLGRLFQIDAELLSENFAIDFAKVLGQIVTIRVETGQAGTRYFNGFVSRFSQTLPLGRLSRYHATIVPWFWMLTRNSDCRIFQKKSVPDIIKEVVADRGFDQFLEVALSGTYREWEYCVQYRETDYNFLSRLMEQEGIYYFYTHENGSHKLVLSDAPRSHKAFEGYAQVPFLHNTGRFENAQYIRDWTINQEIQPGAYELESFDFRAPKKELRSTARVDRQFPGSGYEIFDFPQDYLQPAEGEQYATIRLQEFQANFGVAQAQSDARGLATGYTFELTDFPREDQNKEYLVTAANYFCDTGTFESGTGTGGGTFGVGFTAILAEETFRPTRLTPKPMVQGPQTAIVVGAAGEEIHTDEHGRAKVQFHWDRYGKGNQDSSCFIRVAQGWAGKKWGMLFLPRVGQEVIVEFLEGDPDQPIITGRVYNGDNKTPYDLPANATMSTIKTLSSKGGGGFNEFRFEDKKGDEQIFMHAEKNLDIRTKNNSYQTTQGQYHLIVGNQYEKVGTDKYPGDKHQTVTQDHVEDIKRDHHLKIMGKEAIEIMCDRSVKIGGNLAEQVGGASSHQVGGDYFLKGMGVVIEAAMGITLKCGGNSVVIDAVGVTIKGALVTIDAPMVLIASGPGSPPTPGKAGSLVKPMKPEEAYAADKADPGEVSEYKASQKEKKKGKYAPTPVPPYIPGAKDEEDPDKPKTWIEIELVDEEGNPVPGEKYEIITPDGKSIPGTLDGKGFARHDGLDPGTCKISFPELDKDAWEKG